jgi:hypothetical protein
VDILIAPNAVPDLALLCARLYIQNVLEVALPKYLVVIIRRCQMCIEDAGQQFKQFL